MSWLTHETDPGARRRRPEWEKEQVRLLAMREPMTTEQAYELFGTFLGMLPPLAIFSHFIKGPRGVEEAWAVLFCMLMNVICAVVGRWFAGLLGRGLGDPRARTRTRFVSLVLVKALAWGVVTGGAGGVICYGFGAIGGVLFAAPVALAGFPAFAILHRLLSRGGMIDGRHAWPLALGIPLAIAAVIWSPLFK